MIKVAIIDNNLAQIKSIIKNLDIYSVKNREFIITNAFQYNVSNELYKMNDFDVFFIDVSASNQIDTGFEIGYSIRRLYDDVNIILINNDCNKSVAVRGYSLDAMSILRRPISYKTICSIMNDVVNKKLTKYNKSVFIKYGNGTMRIYESDIQYIETSGKKIIIHTVFDKIECYQRLNKIFTNLSKERFYRCHNSFIVNLDMIKQVNENSVFLGIDIKIPISKNRKKELMDKIAEYPGTRYKEGERDVKRNCFRCIEKNE